MNRALYPSSSRSVTDAGRRGQGGKARARRAISLVSSGPDQMAASSAPSIVSRASLVVGREGLGRAGQDAGRRGRVALREADRARQPLRLAAPSRW